VAAAALLVVAGCSQKSDRAASDQSGRTMAARAPAAGGELLNGSQEVPAVLTTRATGLSTIAVDSNKNVTGKVQTSGINATAAHIHMAPAGQNGPVIVPLTKSSETEWSVPAGAKLTDAQYEAYRQGNLYVNVHTADNPNGEIRAQLKP
jgi:hypothetical protein